MIHSRLAGSPGRLVPALLRRVLSAVLLLAAALAVPACSDGPDSPEALFDQAAQAIMDGRHGDYYDLMTTDQRVSFENDIRGMRETLRRNPGARRMVNQYQVTYEEFLVLPPVELWKRAHKGTESVMIGAKIIDRVTDPVNATDVAITFETRAGQRFRWVTRYEPGRGWRLQSQQAVKLEDRDHPVEDAR